MFDAVHSFRILLTVDPGRAVVVDAGALTPRLPYLGLCSEPQGPIRSLVEQSVDADLRTRLATLVGGPEGCGQLFDLTADLLKLLAFD